MPASPGLFELTLRGDATHLQSLHRFRRGGEEFRAPVLLAPPDGLDLADGRVVELTVRVDPPHRAGGPRRVRYPTVHARESGKQANCVLGAMDLVANGLGVTTLLRDACPLLPRLLITGSIRPARDAFTAAVLRVSGARRILEVGGGRGGDLNAWATAPSVICVEVVDPDAAALVEYRRRLTVSHGARVDGDGDAKLPDGRVFRFHQVPLFDLDPAVGRDADLAVLNFSVSQVVRSRADADALVCGLLNSRRVRRVAVAAHDHVRYGLPPQPPRGIACDIQAPTDCPRHPLFCNGSAPECPPSVHARTAAVLRTTIPGTAMASGITECAFSARYLERTVRRLVAARRLPTTAIVHTEHPFPGEDYHWLLRSLVFLTITVGAPSS